MNCFVFVLKEKLELSNLVNDERINDAYDKFEVCFLDSLNLFAPSKKMYPKIKKQCALVS